jgi:acetolactate synthase regulatory subunit
LIPGKEQVLRLVAGHRGFIVKSLIADEGHDHDAKQTLTRQNQRQTPGCSPESRPESKRE